MATFPQASPPTPCTHLYPPPYAPHALPISFVSILPPAHNWAKSTDHSAPRYAAFSIPLVTSTLLGPNNLLNLQLSYSFKREKHGDTERVQPALSVD
jgi:hypothetical protein